MTTTSGERQAIDRLTAERDNIRGIADRWRDNIRGIADRWRDLCEKATSAAKVAIERAEASEAEVARLTAEVASLTKRLADMAGCIVLKGWWCLPCGIWNGEEHAKREDCRSCARPKTPAEKGPGQ